MDLLRTYVGGSPKDTYLLTPLKARSRARALEHAVACVVVVVKKGVTIKMDLAGHENLRCQESRSNSKAANAHK